MALIGHAVSEEKIFEIVDGRRTDGRRTDHGHPISSPCEPNGSGELKNGKRLFLDRNNKQRCQCLLFGWLAELKLNVPVNKALHASQHFQSCPDEATTSWY